MGGGVNDREDPKDAIIREINEELGLKRKISEITKLCDIITNAKTKEGDMRMNTSVFYYKLNKDDAPQVLDDLSDLAYYSHDELQELIKKIKMLEGDFVTDNFSFSWSDWGEIYAPIHEHALRESLQLQG